MLIGFVHISLGMFKTKEVFTIKQICTDEQPVKCADTLLGILMFYSGTSFNGHILLAATSLMWPLDVVPIEAPLHALKNTPNVLKNTPKCRHLTIP